MLCFYLNDREIKQQARKLFHNEYTVILDRRLNTPAFRHRFSSLWAWSSLSSQLTCQLIRGLYSTDEIRRQFRTTSRSCFYASAVICREDNRKSAVVREKGRRRQKLIHRRFKIRQSNLHGWRRRTISNFSQVYSHRGRTVSVIRLRTTCNYDFI